MNPFITFTPRNNIQCCIRLAQDFDKNPVVTVQPQPRRRVDRARFKIPTKWDGQKWQQGGEACASRQMWQIRQKRYPRIVLSRKNMAFLIREETTGTPDTMKLADLDIPSYEEIAALRDETARRLLIDKGLLHHNRHDLSFKCWSCQAPMDKAGKGYRCSAGRTCKSRPRIEDPLLAFTPFAGYKRRCERPNYVTFVRSAYAFGLRMAPDQAVHMTRTKDTSLVAQTKRIEQLVPEASHRFSLQWVLARGDAQVPNGSGRGWLGQIWERLWMWKTNTFWQDAGPQRASKQTME